MTFDAFRDGKVHICRKMCSTCIFRPGNLMHLNDGRVDEMVRTSIENDTAIICHQTLTSEHQAVCRGFYDRHATTPLIMARHMDVIAYDDLPNNSDKQS